MERESITRHIIIGITTMWAVIQLIAVPAIYMKWSLTTLTRVVLIVLLVAAVIEIACNYKNLARGLRHTVATMSKAGIYGIIFLALLCLQIVAYMFWGHVDNDDAFYVATATTSAATDSLYAYNPYTGAAYDVLPARYVLSPYPLFYAMASQLTGVSATIIAHTLAPILLVTLAYMVYGELGLVLFDGNQKKTSFFLIVLSVINIFSAGARHLQGTMLLFRIWQGKGVLAAILLPLCLLTMLRFSKGKLQWREYLWLVVLMLACCYVSSMGIILGALAIGIYAVTNIILGYHRRDSWMMMLCCVPNVCYAVIYLLIR